MDETTNIDMAAERAARAAKTELEMENVRLRRRLMEAEQRIGRLGRTALGGRERRILKMWPRYEDTGEPVWFGDEVDFGGDVQQAIEFRFMRDSVAIADEFDYEEIFNMGKRVKRPAPEVLDADGVEIHVGDKVWHEDGTMLMVDGFGGVEDGETIVNVHIIRGATPWREVRSLSLTHARPDSWERLEEDAVKSMPKYWGCSFEPCDECPSKIDGKTPAEIYGVSSCSTAKELDIVRRAKRLAGVE